MQTRPETGADVDVVTAVLEAAFPSKDEAELVARLREAHAFSAAVVEDDDGNVRAVAGLSPMDLKASGGGLITPTALSLAPVAVDPPCQRRGFGSAAVEAAKTMAKEAGADVVIVLGDPAYYGRFGTMPCADDGITSCFDAAHLTCVWLSADAKASWAAARGEATVEAKWHPAFGIE